MLNKLIEACTNTTGTIECTLFDGVDLLIDGTQLCTDDTVEAGLQSVANQYGPLHHAFL